MQQAIELWWTVQPKEKEWGKGCSSAKTIVGREDVLVKGRGQVVTKKEGGGQSMAKIEAGG